MTDTEIRKLGREVADLDRRRDAKMTKLVELLVAEDKASGGKRRAELAKLSGLSRETVYQRLRKAGQVEPRKPSAAGEAGMQAARDAAAVVRSIGRRD